MLKNIVTIASATVAIILLLFIAAWWTAIAAYGETVALMIVVALAVAISVLLVALVLRIYDWLRDMYFNTGHAQRMARIAERHATNEADQAGVRTEVAPAGNQVFVISKPDSPLVAKPAHLTPRGANGAQLLPASILDVQQWLAWNSLHASASKPQIIEHQAPQLQAPQNWPVLVNLLDLLPGGRGDLANIVLGVTLDAAGQQQVVRVPLWQMMHGALGGETGSGKSTLGYSIAFQLATARGQDTAQLVLVDPGETSFKTLARCDRLLWPVISSEVELSQALAALHDERRRRTELFKPHPTVESLQEYHQQSGDRLPYVVVMIDELPELMEDSAVEKDLRRLIRVSRKFGIFIFGMGTDWRANTLDSAIRDQFRTKIHFASSKPSSSRVLLDSPVAAELRHAGRAYARLPFSASPDLVQIQAPYLDKHAAMKLLPARTSLPAELPVVVTTDDEKQQVAEFVRLVVEDGLSRREACQQVFGVQYGGSIVDKLKAALEGATTTTE